MGYSEAIRMLTGSPRSADWRRSRVIISVSSPRRRWVGETVTLVRAALVTSAGPGTVRGAPTAIEIHIAHVIVTLTLGRVGQETNCFGLDPVVDLGPFNGSDREA